MIPTLLKKELREQRRTHRLLIYLAGFTLIGMLSPLIARYTPVLLRSIPDVPAGLAALIPDPTINDVVAQYVKNFSQIGLLLVIVLSMGLIAQEKERGTIAMLFTKPLQRWGFVLGKWLASLTGMLIGLLLAAAGCLLYTYILFEPLPVVSFLALNALLAVFLGVYLTLALAGSAVARSQPMAAGAAFGLMVLLLVLGAIPRLSEYLPGRLLAWGTALVIGEEFSAWPALVVSLMIIGLTLLGACLFLEREEY
jgi:ABC-2 type transport system permease protein